VYETTRSRVSDSRGIQMTEITQNQSATVVEKETLETIDGERRIVTIKKPGDFVVCNLSSINLGRAEPDQVLERLLKIEVRMLDNVIGLNKGRIEVLQAEETNERYHSIGLGTFGWNHLLALKGIAWETDEAVNYCDELYEEIAYLAIKASMELAQEKGAYPLFKGSDWDTGAYFVKRDYVTPDLQTSKSNKFDWAKLASEVNQHGVRNAYIMAVAPNMSTATIAASTASIDPIFKKMYAEEKKGIKIPVVVPDLNPSTNWYYKSAYLIDQHWSIKQNAKRQRHIDQGISFNFYVPNNIKASELLDLHMTAWKEKLKTTYYVRSTSQAVIDDCESCQ